MAPAAPAPFVMMETPVETPAGKVSGGFHVGGGLGCMKEHCAGGPGLGGRVRFGIKGRGDIGLSFSNVFAFLGDEHGTAMVDAWGFDVHYKLVVKDSFVLRPGLGLAGVNQAAAINASLAMVFAAKTDIRFFYMGLTLDYARVITQEKVPNSVYALVAVGLISPFNNEKGVVNFFVELGGGPIITWYRRPSSDEDELDVLVSGGAYLGMGFEYIPY